MDCNHAELAMMAHVEKTILPADAKDLAQHLMGCEVCREYFVGFDMALEVLDDEKLSIPPINFTQNVMAQVSKLPAHSQAGISVILRVIWGLGAIVIGVGFLLAFNPDWLNAFMASPIVEAVVSTIDGFRLFFAEMLEMSGYQAGNLEGLSMFNAALVFVIVMGALLMVLQISEKSTNS